MAMPNPLAVYQRPMRTGCCRRVYHMAVTSMKLGSEQASAAPERARRTASVAKLVAPAWAINKTPHRKMLKPRYLATGKRCIRKLVGKDQTRKPK